MNDTQTATRRYVQVSAKPENMGMTYDSFTLWTQCQNEEQTVNMAAMKYLRENGFSDGRNLTVWVFDDSEPESDLRHGPLTIRQFKFNYSLRGESA